MDLTSKIQASTWGWTAVGAAFTYAAGHKHGASEGGRGTAIGATTPRDARPPCPAPASHAAHKIGMTGLRGHRFGFILSIPIFFLGWSNGVHDQLQRFQGLKPNGRPARFPQYKSDLVPYFVKREGEEGGSACAAIPACTAIPASLHASTRARAPRPSPPPPPADKVTTRVVLSPDQEVTPRTLI